MNSRGFTLVEVLVALAVLGLALVAAMRAGGQGTIGFAQARERMLADWVAADRLAELRAAGVWPDPGISEGEAEQGGERFRWRQKVSPTPNGDFRRAAVEVAGRDGVVLSELVGVLWRGGGR